MPNNILKIYYIDTAYDDFWGYLLDKLGKRIVEERYGQVRGAGNARQDCKCIVKILKEDGYDIEYGEDKKFNNWNIESFILIDEKVYLNFILKIS